MAGATDPGKRRWNVLFLCTGNSARSIMAEAICNAEWPDRLHGYSAGSHPKGEVHPMALEMLRRLDHDPEGLRSKGWEEFAHPDAPRMDFVFTVCDDAVGEVRPIWPGQPVSAHWGAPDPARATGTPAEVALAFDRAYGMLRRRIGLFASLPIATLPGLRLKRAVDRIGEGEKPEGAVQAPADNG